MFKDGNVVHSQTENLKQSDFQAFHQQIIDCYHSLLRIFEHDNTKLTYGIYV